MKLSNEMQAILTATGLKPENVLYLTIARQYLNKIRLGQKKVEFRALTYFYLQKLCKLDSKGNLIGEKPITHLLLQGGYTGDSPRVLVELKDWFFHDNDDTPTEPAEMDAAVKSEAEAEGFTDEDEYIGLVMGNVILAENFKW